MADKRMQVIEAAMRLFAEKGFHSTSIQEIATAAGIAKGSMYLYFKSKDDLLLTIYKTFFDKLVQDAAEAAEKGAAPREALELLLRMQFAKVKEYKDFITMQMREQFVHTNREIKEMAMGMRLKSFSIMEERVMQAYGEDLRPWAMDCTTLLESMISSYMAMMIMNTLDVDTDRVAAFLLGRLDDVAQGLMRERPKPILQLQHLGRLSCGTRQESGPDRVKDRLNRLREAIGQSGAEEDAKRDLLASVQVLEEELLAPERRKVVVRGMLAYLLQAGGEELSGVVKGLQDAADAVLDIGGE